MQHKQYTLTQNHITSPGSGPYIIVPQSNTESVLKLASHIIHTTSRPEGLGTGACIIGSVVLWFTCQQKQGDQWRCSCYLAIRLVGISMQIAAIKMCNYSFIKNARNHGTVLTGGRWLMSDLTIFPAGRVQPCHVNETVCNTKATLCVTPGQRTK